MRSIVSRSLTAGVAIVLALVIAPATVLAYGGQGDENKSPRAVLAAEDRQGNRGDELKQEIQELRQQRQQERQQRLEENKLRVCEQRKSKIQAIMNRSVTRAERQLGLFTKISDRVKAFYEDKGYNVANYDDLVAAVEAAKANAEANLETLKDLDSFDCDSEDPKGNVEAFKLAIHSINQDLKDYRTSVKNLIVGVKSAQSTAAKDETEDSTEDGGDSQDDQQEQEEGGEQ